MLALLLRLWLQARRSEDALRQALDNAVARHILSDEQRAFILAHPYGQDA